MYRLCLLLIFVMRVGAVVTGKHSFEIPLMFLRNWDKMGTGESKESSEPKEFDTTWSSPAIVVIKGNQVRLKAEVNKKMTSVHDAVIHLEFHNVTRPRRLGNGVFLAEFDRGRSGERETRPMLEVAVGRSTVDVAFNVTDLVHEVMMRPEVGGRRKFRMRMRLHRMPKKLPRGALQEGDIRCYLVLRGFSVPENFSTLTKSWSLPRKYKSPLSVKSCDPAV